MPEMYRIYINSMHDFWGEGYWVTWHPSVRLRLGEVGAVKGGQLVTVGSLEGMRIPYDATPAQSRDQLTYSSAGGVSFTFKAAGEPGPAFQILAQAQAGALITFKGENSLVVSLRDLAETRIVDLPQLAKAVVERYLAGDWQADFAVVTHLVTAGSGTLLASTVGGSQVELLATAAIGQGPVTIADLSANVAVARSDALELQLLGQGLTPFFRVLRLKEGWLGGIKVRFGDAQPFRTSKARTSGEYQELLEEAMDEPEEVLEDLDQGSADDGPATVRTSSADG
jgi:hypothetical protein